MSALLCTMRSWAGEINGPLAAAPCRCHTGPMLHIAKLAVGVRDVQHLASLQNERAAVAPPLCHRTRNLPRRADQVTSGGSLYWVIGGIMTVRQAILAVRPDQWDDGSRCAALLLGPALVAVAPRPVRAFQGWRYLEAADAPADLAGGEAGDDIPETIRRGLAALCLL